MPAPTMLATTTNVAIDRPNSAGIRSSIAAIGSPVADFVLDSDIISSIESLRKRGAKSKTEDKFVKSWRSGGQMPCNDRRILYRGYAA